ncbi:MAG: histidine phosphatase family protein [Corynebacterium sp.]|nr:histidine phosphatase family protein [Corynebacterium sp.]
MCRTIVHLVRHGEVYNPDKILYGRIPGYHLSSRGRSQAAATAKSFQGHNVRFLASSPLQRALETAEPFAEVTGLDPIVDEDLLEAGNQFEGLRVRGIRSQLWNPKYWQLMKNPLQPSWGEHYIDIQRRMMVAVKRARLRAEGSEAILVTHQLPIVCVQRYVRGLPLAHNPSKRQCELASVTSLVFHDTDITDIYYSEPAREI